MHGRCLSLVRCGLAGAVLTGSLAAATSAQAQVEANAQVQGTGAFAGTGAGAVGGTDHDRFVGSFAVGYLGASLIPFAENVTVGGPGPGTAMMSADAASVYAPAVGIRYWLTDMIGLDVGLGFRSFSGSVKQKVADYNAPGAAPAPVVFTWEHDKLNQLGFLLHAGVPIALDTEDHYVFEIVPEANIGFSSGSSKEQPYVPPYAAPPPVLRDDIKVSGMRFDVGVRAGAEIHFGFMDLPNLALQAGVGLYLSMEKFKADGGSLAQTDPANPGTARPKTTYEDSSTTISTSVNGDPWGIFAQSVSALYYF